MDNSETINGVDAFLLSSVKSGGLPPRIDEIDMPATDDWQNLGTPQTI